MVRSLPVLLAALAVAIGAVALESSSRARQPLIGVRAPRPAPSWKNARWLDADRPPILEGLLGRGVPLNFWVFTWGTCTRTAHCAVAGTFRPEVPERRAHAHRDPHPVISPWAGEHGRMNVGQALRRCDTAYPNAQGNDSRTRDIYGIRYWPGFALIDDRGPFATRGSASST